MLVKADIIAALETETDPTVIQRLNLQLEAVNRIVDADLRAIKVFKLYADEYEDGDAFKTFMEGKISDLQNEIQTILGSGSSGGSGS